MVTIEIGYQGQLRCEATHSPSGCQITTDAPTDNHGKGESFSPTDLVATALGTCIITIMGIVAQRHSIELAGSTVIVEKHMSTDMPRRIVRLSVVVVVRSQPELDAASRKTLEEAAQHCPVHESLHPSIEAPIRFDYPTN